MKLKDVIHAANLHATTAHAQAKADAVEAPPSKPKRWRLERGMVVEGEWEPHPMGGKSIRTIAKAHGECLADFDKNGLLLAAAPELLEALDTLNLVVGLTPIKGNLEAIQEACDKARAAIAKAKGSL